MAFDVPKAMAASETDDARPAPGPAPRPLALAPALAPVLDLGAPPGPALGGTDGAGDRPDPGAPPPDGPSPDGGAPKPGRPHLTRIK
jgi:hypothetical protein